ncbi:MAG: sigma-54 dependent transcriptional regulator [Pseudomonadota bacterium]
MINVLIVEDEIENLNSIATILEKEGMSVLKAQSGNAALEIIRKQQVDVVLTDLVMEGIAGDELLSIIKKLYPEIEVIMMTAYGTIEIAVDVMKNGGYDFITKPIKRVMLVKTIKKAIEKLELKKENILLKEELNRIKSERFLIGNSKPMQNLLDIIRQVAPSTSTILVEGESGTGKELVADAVHTYSHRKQKPFIKLSCAALPESLLETELFGYEKGAFTGADNRKEGRFMLADKGTLFLDEVAEMSLKVQTKFLRVLQEGEFERVGGVDTVKVDVRIIAATNKKLEDSVKNGEFREDLFYRLNVINIKVPALKEHMDDIPLLVNFFIEKYSKRNDKEIHGISDEALEALQKHDWPGNIRELENIIERAVVLAKAGHLDLDDLPQSISGKDPEKVYKIPYGTPLKDIEKVVILDTLKLSGGDKNLTAKMLGVAERTIYRKLDEYLK